MLAAAIIFGIIGALCGLVGLWYGWQGLRKADEANRKAGDANAIAVASRKEAEKANALATEANSLSEQSNKTAQESNTIAVEANKIAVRAMQAQEDADRRSHTAQLMLVGGKSGRRRDDGRGAVLVVALQNDGIADAKDITMKIKRSGESDWYRSDSVPELESGKVYNFSFVIEQDFFRENEGGRLLDYLITYRDRLGDHTKQFRVQMSGESEQRASGWSFTLLDTCLDGRRVRFADAPEKLAGGVAFTEGEGICT